MTSPEHARYEEDLAPYLLGALTPTEAQELELHLRSCASCQEQLGRLRIGAEALARSVAPIEPPASLRERVLSEVSAERSGAPDSEAARVAAAPSSPSADSLPPRLDPVAAPGRRRPRRRSPRLGRRARRLGPRGRGSGPA